MLENFDPIFEGLDRLTGRALLVLDVDETLVRTPDHHGSEAWFHARIEAGVSAGVSFREAVETTYEAWKAVHASLDLIATEADLAARLRAVATRHEVIGLTARGADFAARTRAQLRHVGIDLPGGILYAGPLGNKGETLASFLLTRPTPDFVYFVDDRAEHVETVGAHLRDRRIPHVAARIRVRR